MSCLMISALFVEASNGQTPRDIAAKTSEDFRANIEFDYIFVCSSIDGVNANSVRKFISSNFSDRDAPTVIDGYSDQAELSARKVFFYAAGKERRKDASECAKKFSSKLPSLPALLDSRHEVIGTRSELPPHIPYRNHLEGVRSSWSYAYSERWRFMIFVSLETGMYRVRHALTGLIGYNVDDCQLLLVCPSDDNGTIER